MRFLEDALEVREELKSGFPLFPSLCCKIAVRKMSERGYLIVAGFVEVDNYCGLGERKRMRHLWNYDKETGKEFDITASQFNIHFKDRRFEDIEVWDVIQYNDAYILEKFNVDPDKVF